MSADMAEIVGLESGSMDDDGVVPTERQCLLSIALSLKRLADLAEAANEPEE